MSDWQSTLSVIERLAPTIGTVLGGPLVGGGISALEGVFGLTPAPAAATSDRQSAIAAAISGATPDQLLALKTADQNYAVAMSGLGFKDKETLAALVVQDTVSARTMQSDTKSYMPPLFTIFVTIGFFGMLLLLMFVNVPEANKAILYGFTGTLGTVWGASAHFWFGDTQASARTTELLAQSTPPI
ncbi:hypothetical protein [Glaciimonas immobilis]|uniref:Uncharacterized protein n=1 Tax=Glaciimonas immobilis TaxID=728004 RepID=A0A840RW12_9BURK|nr:hypothetical protein [Glaciimonas immobilis]KAF3997561.1 hypothetical protein HAV38_12855 [Glaciimonas immobilis]MBB5200751.1 hypothetical protein [Glaciimonas immobilis]